MSSTHEKSSDLEKGDGSSYNGVTVVPTAAAHMQDLHDDVPRNKGVFAGVSSISIF